ncbi:sensor histidine kinase [Aquabacterium humicola]|uniref:sensor histidine kinase n=1 Tax=Aquabacterium humicola TaxID=3237377 RepID=UPI002543ABB7|nr:sensor histidine kinase [Rubrivivax pictus]
MSQTLRRPRSLRWRMLAATLLALVLALVLSGGALARLFRQEAMRQFEATLAAQLDQLTARFDLDAEGRPQIDEARLTDPRWSRPYSGLYWQIDAASGVQLERAVLRSRSLWDTALQAPADAIADGALHLHTLAGPEGAELRVLERTVRRADAATGAQRSWRLLVAADTAPARAAAHRFDRALGASLLALFALLGIAALVQVAIGLAPLRTLQRALQALDGGAAQRLDGRFPAELQPLVDHFNAVLDRNAEIVARARTQAGNLAHALKTPLAAMAQQADAAGRDPAAAADLPALVREQVAQARRHVDWNLARARAAAAQGLPGVRTALEPVLRDLVRVLSRLHAARTINLHVDALPVDAAFAGEQEDLQEMLGNLLENACQWARSEVRVSVSPQAPGRLAITIEDDGPGIEASRRAQVLARGARLDESVPGSGLGLSIVKEIAGLYGGSLTLERGTAGGLRAVLVLPEVPLPLR